MLRVRNNCLKSNVSTFWKVPVIFSNCGLFFRSTSLSVFRIKKSDKCYQCLSSIISVLMYFMSLSRALCIITTIKINNNILKTIFVFITRVKLKLYRVMLLKLLLNLAILLCLHIFPHIGHMNCLNSQNNLC